MSGGVKAPFWVQVVAVILVLVLVVLCIPMPGGGLLINRLTGSVPGGNIVPAPRIAGIVAAPAPVTTPAQVPVAASTRFSQAVNVGAKPDEYWTAATVEGQNVWLDAQSGMVSGARLAATVPDFSAASLKTAQEACAAQTPAGAWALPTAAEFDIAKVNGIMQSDSDAKHKWITWQEIPPGLVIPSVRGYVRAGTETGYAIRCIARTSTAPADGYRATDNATTLKAMAE